MADDEPSNKGKGLAQQEAPADIRTDGQSNHDRNDHSSVQHPAATPGLKAQPDDEAAPPTLPPRPSPSRAHDDYERHQVPLTQPRRQSRQPTAKELAQQPYTHELRLLPPYNKTFSRIKLWLAMLLFAWGASVTAISAIVLAEFLGSERPVGIEYPCSFGIPFGVINMIWNVAEVLTLCARGSNSIYPRGIHPGAHVGVHLVLMLCSVAGVVLGSNTLSVYDQVQRLCNGRDPSLYWPFCRGYKDGTWFNPFMKELVIALLAAFSVMLLIHITLFVWACVDTHHRNRLSLGRLLAAPAGAEAGFPMREPPQGVPQKPMQEAETATKPTSTDKPVVEEKTEEKVLQNPHNPTRHLGNKAPGQAAVQPGMDHTDEAQTSSSAAQG
ncbi:hypothetical protein Micbo1qcDRAFT_163188 [Microdochium bolleyi]|uniref:Uncharacterized protein n=1 Tax=Microdochium bolleyi TaxID=196109 RepID=A0A136J2Y5_9PEZI|nr:hypothetical protein Micbo1qcDRAFT_163188 [Microdochium bolleyi]